MQVVAVVNRKGGVGKTTTAVNLAAALALGGVRTLLVDLDPQGSVGRALGLLAVGGAGSSAWFTGKGSRPTVCFLGRPETTRLGIVPADDALAEVEAHLLDAPRRRDRLAKGLEQIDSSWGVALIDTPPALGALTDAALRAADGVVMPATLDYLAVESLRTAVDAVRRAEKAHDRRYQPLAVLPTMVEPQRTASRTGLTLLGDQVGELLLGVEIPRSARADSSALAGVPLVLATPTAPVAMAYRAAARELLAQLSDRPVSRRAAVKRFVKTDLRAELLRRRRR
jgi:chromosome partitioning protein